MPLSLTRSQVRNIDSQAIADYGLAGIVLMENAGRGAAEVLVGLGIKGPVVICAGKGNNGGDGFVMARHLELHDIETNVLLFCEPHELAPDAACNYRVLTRAQQHIDVLGKTPDQAVLARRLSAAEWIVDALFGTGTQGSIREPYLTAIAAINGSGKKVFAVDLPSGMDCDTGQPLGASVRADHTATFVARKVGFDAPRAAALTGLVHVVGIGVPKRLLQGLDKK
jgi:NAD(P)H-hydrate epimerase